MQTNQNLFSRRISIVTEILALTKDVFSRKKPVDRFISGYFRQNKKFGSKDRRLISNSVFGFYRWYGWLKSVESPSLALLLGYLLDKNPVEPLIQFWAEEEKIDETFLQQIQKAETVSEKFDLIQKIHQNISIEELVPSFSKSALQYIDHIQKRTPTWLRVDPNIQEFVVKFLEKNDVIHQVHPEFINCIAIFSPLQITQLSWFKKGQLEIQDISSQAIGWFCDPKSKETWWDVCAGAGGKSLHLSRLMKGKGKILATEIRPYSIQEMRKRVTRTNTKNVTVQEWDGIQEPPREFRFNGVLVDAPCSSSGTWSRNPEVRWYYTQEDILNFQKQQLEILENASKEVMSGGSLVYSTCSIHLEENEDVIQKFLEKNPNFILEQKPLSFSHGEIGHYFSPPTLDGNIMYAAKMISK
ncbi:MAG: 16S rRNA (cytosine967-C5)-methyltransferase [bacterium]|jgi:16S rRNA (cytosine967-C5)-methyltransferase